MASQMMNTQINNEMDAIETEVEVVTRIQRNAGTVTLVLSDGTKSHETTRELPGKLGKTEVENSESSKKGYKTRRSNVAARETEQHLAASNQLAQLSLSNVLQSALLAAGKSEAEVDALVDYSAKLGHAIRTCAVKRAFHQKRSAKFAKKAQQKATNAAKQKVRSQGISKDKKKKSALSLLASLDPAELAALLAQQQQQQQLVA